MNLDMAKVNNLYQMFRTGKYSNDDNPRNKNHEQYTYTINPDQSIRIILETANLDAFEGSLEEKTNAQKRNFQNMQRDIIQALEYHGLHGEPPSPNYSVDVNSPHIITITASGFSTLKSMRAVANGPRGKINTDALKFAINVPEKIINLLYGEKESKTNIVKNIIENRDEHFSFVGDSTGVNSYVSVKEDYAPLTEVLLNAFENCIASIHPLRNPRSEKRKFITQNITIDLYTQRFENAELEGKIELVSSNVDLKELATQFKQLLDNKRLIEDTDYLFDGNHFQLFREGIEKIAGMTIDFRMRHLCDQSTQTTPTPNRTTLVRTIQSTTQNDILFTFLNCTDNASALLDSLNRYYSRNNFADKKPHIFIFSNSHKITKNVIYLGQQGYANVYGSVNPRSTGHATQLLAVRRDVMATRERTELESQLLSCFDQITTHENKLTLFANDAAIVNTFKKTKDLKILNGLFQLLLEYQEDIDIHSNMIGTFLFWKGNTETFKKLLGYIREYAMTIFKERCGPMTFEQAEKFRDECLDLDIFNTHRSNNILAWIFTNTDAVNEIKEIVKEKNPSNDKSSENETDDTHAYSSSSSESDNDSDEESKVNDKNSPANKDSNVNPETQHRM